MINHVRTLIMNKSGQSLGTYGTLTKYLEEYVDPSFAEVSLPSPLLAVYNTIFPRGADEAFVNFRMRQITTILSSTEFNAYVLDLDPRITYENSGSVVGETKRITITGMDSVAANTTVYTFGTLTAATISRPVLFRSWLMEVTAPLQVRTTNLQTGQSIEAAVTISSNLTSPIILAGAPELSVRIVGASLTVGSKWTIETFAPADADIADLIKPLTKVVEQRPQIFFPNNVEPFKTFKALWDKHPLINYRLSGLFLALAYQVEKLREVENG